MDGQPVSFDDVATVEHGRSYMPNRVINQSGVAAPTLAMRANASVFSTKDRPYENPVGVIREHPLYPGHPATFKSYVPVEERTLPSIEATAASRSNSVSGNDNLMNARQVATKLGVSERWVRDHTTRRSPRIRGLKMGSLMRYRLTDVEAFLVELDTQPSSRPSRFRV